MIIELQELFDFVEQSSVFGKVIPKRLTLEKVATMLIATEMVIAMIAIRGQDFKYDWIADGVIVGGSNFLKFARNIFMGLSIGCRAFIASHQDLIYCSCKQKLL